MNQRSTRRLIDGVFEFHAPADVQNIQHALVIPKQHSRARSEVFQALDIDVYSKQSTR